MNGQLGICYEQLGVWCYFDIQSLDSLLRTPVWGRWENAQNCAEKCDCALIWESLWLNGSMWRNRKIKLHLMMIDLHFGIKYAVAVDPFSRFCGWFIWGEGNSSPKLILISICYSEKRLVRILKLICSKQVGLQCWNFACR